MTPWTLTKTTLFLAIWETLVRLAPTNVLVASPSDIAMFAGENGALLFRAALETSKNAALGFVFGNLAGLFLAALIFLVPRSERLIAPLALVVFSLPLIATGPILRVLFGPGPGPQIMLGALAVYYSTFLAALVGLRAVPQGWTDLLRVYGRGPWTTLIKVRARASLPYLFVGLQIAAPAAFLGAMIGEFTGAERGLGVLTLRAMRGLQVDGTWTLAALSAVIAMAAYAALGVLGRRLFDGRPPLLLFAPSASRRKTSATRQFLEALGIAAIILLLWYGLMETFELNRFFAKRPGDVLAFLAEAEPRATLLKALSETLAFTLPGYLAGLALGAGLAAVLVLSPALEKVTLPVAVLLRAVPIITTSPLLVLAFGRGFVGTVVVVAVMIFFPTLVACLQGLRQTPGQVTDLFVSYGASRWRLLLSAQAPAMLPAFFASARMAVPAALLAVTTAEWLATGQGIGVLMALTASTSDYNMLWSCVASLGVVAMVLYGLVGLCERAVLRRYAPEQLP
ncbi:MAG: ABC transporter permease subunit [Pseudomonadota bacterium]